MLAPEGAIDSLAGQPEYFSRRDNEPDRTDRKHRPISDVGIRLNRSNMPVVARVG